MQNSSSKIDEDTPTFENLIMDAQRRSRRSAFLSVFWMFVTIIVSLFFAFSLFEFQETNNRINELEDRLIESQTRARELIDKLEETSASVETLESKLLERLEDQDAKIHALTLTQKKLEGKKLTTAEQRFLEHEAQKALEKSKSTGGFDQFFYGGQAAFFRDDYKAAVDKFTKAIELDPERKEAYRFRARSLGHLGDYQGAVRDLSKAILIGPEAAKMYTNRGYYRDLLGDFTEAISDFDRAIELDPSSAQTYHNRGINMMRMGDLARSESDFRKAAEFFTGPIRIAGSLENLGILRLRQQRWQEAFDQTTEVNKIYDRMRWNWLVRAIAADHLGLEKEVEIAHARWRELKVEGDAKALRSYLPKELHHYLEDR